MTEEETEKVHTLRVQDVRLC